MEFVKIANKIKSKTLKFIKEAKDNGELYGSIKPKEVSNAFNIDLKVEISPSQIDLKQEINKVGNFSLTINLHSDLVTELHVTVEKKELK